MHFLFWISIAVVLYTYFGYLLLLLAGVAMKRILRPGEKRAPVSSTPSLTVVVAAYNEEVCIEEKIINTLSLDYPPDMLQFIFVTDGSTDDTPRILSRYPQIRLMHRSEREGKIAAINRAMAAVSTEIVVFTDANTMLNKEALRRIASHYSDKRVGAVAGEKRVSMPVHANATAGEGMYWKYESFIKQYESELHTVAGAAGELFSIRTQLFTPVAADTILDDLLISVHIALRGYRIRYERGAIATEQPSLSIREENKRKKRIAAGDIQAMMRIPFFTMLFTRPLLWLEYTSHRVLRWIIAPYALIAALIANILLATGPSATPLYTALLYVQFFFYGMSLLGFLLRNNHIRPGFFFAPCYFCLMHYNLIAGTIKYLVKGQEVGWARAEREGNQNR